MPTRTRAKLCKVRKNWGCFIQRFTYQLPTLTEDNCSRFLLLLLDEGFVETHAPFAAFNDFMQVVIVHVFRPNVYEHVLRRCPFQLSARFAQNLTDPSHRESKAFLRPVRWRVTVALVEDVFGICYDTKRNCVSGRLQKGQAEQQCIPTSAKQSNVKSYSSAP